MYSMYSCNIIATSTFVVRDIFFCYVSLFYPWSCLLPWTKRVLWKFGGAIVSIPILGLAGYTKLQLAVLRAKSIGLMFSSLRPSR
jgi:hypothetical protein